MRGVYTAIVTPFEKSGWGIDQASFEALIARQIDAGVDGIVVAGSTGEGQTLQDKEWEQALKIAVGYRSDIQVMVSAGSSATWQSVEMAEKAAKLGAHSLLVSTPPYNKPPQDALISHFDEIAKATPELPIMIYNIPGRTAVNLKPESLEELWKTKNIMAIKESAGDWSQALQMIRSCPEGKSVFSGDDPLHYALGVHGGSGAVSVISNLSPKILVGLWRAVEKEDIASAKKIFGQMESCVESLFLESNPIPVKWAVGQVLKKDLAPRAPLRTLKHEFQSRVQKEIEELRKNDWL